ncbi:MAG: response regulator [Bacteroidetes bacterium]|nr:response regulator [Bacteroidota bacterium]
MRNYKFPGQTARVALISTALFLLLASYAGANTYCVDCDQDSLRMELREPISDSVRIYILAELINSQVIPASLDDGLVFRDLHLLDSLNRKLNLIDFSPYSLIKQGLEQWSKNESEKAINTFKEAIRILDQQDRIFGTNSLLTGIREFYNEKSWHEERLIFYTEKLNYYLQNGPWQNTAACYHGIAGYYSFKADYNRAISNYLKSAEVYERFSLLGYSNEITVAGMMYSRWGNYDRALYYLKKALPINRKLQGGNLPGGLIELTIVYRETKEFEKALKSGIEAYEYSVKLGDLERAAIAQAELACLFTLTGQDEAALNSLQKARMFGDSSHLTIASARGNFEIDFYQFAYYLRKKEYQKAEEYLVEAYRKANNAGANELKLKYGYQLFKFYSLVGEQERATERAAQYFQLRDSLVESEGANHIAQYEIEQEEKKSREKIQLLDEQRKSQQRNYLIAGLVLVVIAGGLLNRLLFVRKTKRQLEEKNRQVEFAKNRAEQSEKFKQQFLANMSHEIRTPMNAILGMTNLALESPSAEKQKEYLGGIQKSSDMLLHIINDILDVSKIEAGKIEIEQIDFSLKEVVEQVKRTLQHKADEKHIQLITSIDKAVPDVLVGDPVRLNQVLMNLCGNALKFTERGSVHLSVIARNEGQTLSESVTKQSPALGHNSGGLLRPAKSGARNDAALLFEVEDTGIGIPKEKLNSIFESFTQAHSSDSRRFGGTGLGLTISKQLIELMGGELKVESEPGSGSTFSFTLALPVGSEQNLESRKKSEEELDGSMLNGLKILLADDNEYNRVVATDTLKSKADVEIITATNGREAVDLLKQNDFDVVLMDVQMPEMDGFEATREIRHPQSAIRNHNIPVIALTASVIRSDLDKCKAAGMNDYVPKPFKASQLIHAIASITGRSKSAQPPNPPKGELLPGAERKGSPYSESEGSADKTSNLKLKTSNSIDLTYLRNFCEGDEERMKKYISMFLESIPPFKEKLEQAVAADDLAEIAKQVHAMKPKFVMMGMKEAYTLSIQVETDVQKSNQQHQFNPAMRRILLICGQAEKELSESLNTP